MTFNLATERVASDDKLAYTAGSNITAGTPVLTSLGVVGIPANDIASGDTDEVDICGRFRAWGVASQAWAVGDRVGWDANGDPLNGTAGSGAYTKTVTDWDFAVGTVAEAKGATTEMGVILLDEPAAIFIPSGAQQSLSGAGAVNVTSFSTMWTTSGAQAGTLANGTRIGQLKEIMLTVDGGDGTLTPATASGFTTIVFSNIGDMVLLQWTAGGWIILKRGNVATAAITTPVAA
jgi:predicted RecA/RadA family phage recombinase